MSKVEIESPERRKFLCTVPVAAAAGIILTDASLFASPAAAQSADAQANHESFKVIEAPVVEQAIQKLEAHPGNDSLYHSKLLAVTLTSEKAASAKEFEWHEHRDHVFHILEGSTIYELGGTPQNAHSTGPGEWLAPASQGATSVTLTKGAFLVIPRGTPHRRTTKDSVLLALIAPSAG